MYIISLSFVGKFCYEILLLTVWPGEQFRPGGELKHLFQNCLVPKQVNQYILDSDENTMLSSQLTNVVYGIPEVWIL